MTMKTEEFDLTNLQIASPCSVDWNTMRGDERKRFCDLCELNVYNVAGMTEKEVRELVSLANGRLCMRLMRRADGSVMTQDCPVGLAAYRKRVARYAGAAMATVLGLFSVSYGQRNDPRKPATGAKIARTTDKIILIGAIRDPTGLPVSGALVRVSLQVGGPEITSTSDGEGRFYIPLEKSAIYKLEVRVVSFKPYEIDGLKTSQNQQMDLNIVLEPERVFMGLMVQVPVRQTPVELNDPPTGPVQSDDNEN